MKFFFQNFVNLNIYGRVEYFQLATPPIVHKLGVLPIILFTFIHFFTFIVMEDLTVDTAVATVATVTERTLVGAELLKIKKTTLVRPYNSESIGFKDKNYRIYTFGLHAFAVHEDDDFHASFARGDVQSVDVAISDAGWSFVNAVTWTQARAQRLNSVSFDAITAANYISGKLSAAQVAELEANA
jgi:hypothetical protein